MSRCLYIYLDEAGNFDFSPRGTRYFMLGSVALQRPFGFLAPLAELRMDLLERDLDVERFHASDDQQATRNAVFGIIREHLDNICIDATVVEKCKTVPALQPVEHFYPRMLGYHLRYVLEHTNLADYDRVVIVTDALPVQRKRAAVAKAVKLILADMLPITVPYSVLHHESKSSAGLQVADYCTWAIYRKWDGNDERSYQVIARAIRSEFDIFRTGVKRYY